MGERIGDSTLGSIPRSMPFVLDCAIVPETASTIAPSIGGRLISSSSLSSSPTPRGLGVPSEDSRGWLHPSQRSAPEGFQHLFQALEQKLCAEVLRVQQHADLQLRELDKKLAAQVAAQERRLDSFLDEQATTSKRQASGEIGKRLHSLERQGDDLCDRLKQTSLALLNFNDRITAAESKLTVLCAATQPKFPTLGERLPFASFSAAVPPSTGLSMSGKETHDIRNDVTDRIDRERSERVAGMQDVRQVVHENRARILETREQLLLLAQRFKGQERDQEDFREMQERFFSDARSALAPALAASVSVPPLPNTQPRSSHGLGRF